MDRKLVRDLARVQQAIRDVVDASRAESAAFRRAFDERSPDAWTDLYRLHLDEADAIHRLAMLTALIERRHEPVMRLLSSTPQGPGRRGR